MRFTKTPRNPENYLPTYYNGFTMVHKKAKIMSMREIQGFCETNNLPSSRFAKMQGGYYILNSNWSWEFYAKYLNQITFENLYKTLKNLK